LGACDKNPNLKQYDGSLNLKAWGVIKVKFSELLRDIRRLNKHLIFVAHEKEETFENIVRKRPDVSGSAGKDIMKELDLMGYMHIRNKKRVISFTPDDNYYAKNCFDLEPIIEIPSHGNAFISDVLLRKIEEKRILGAEMAQQYKDLVKSQEVEIDDANTVDEINQAYERLTQSPKVWDSELCWKQRLQNKCKSIGVIYNKDLGQFISREDMQNQPAA
jgi:hypothetical protein